MKNIKTVACVLTASIRVEHAPVCEQVPSPMKMHKNLKRQKDLMPLYLYLMSDDSIEVSGQSLDAQPDRKAGPAE